MMTMMMVMIVGKYDTMDVVSMLEKLSFHIYSLIEMANRILHIIKIWPADGRVLRGDNRNRNRRRPDAFKVNQMPLRHIHP